MAKPIWITSSSLGSFSANTQMSVLLIAKPVSPAISVTYSLISGSLPTGTSLSSTGFITGSPNVSSSATYTFIVQAIDNLGNSKSQTFSMVIDYSLPQPSWTTEPGSIGRYPYSIAMTYELVAEPVSPATSITSYQIITGSLPNGLTFNTTTGIISGTPSLVTQDTVSTFTIRATDNLNSIRDGTFNMTVSGTAVPEFTTPDGELLSTWDSLWTQLQINYSNPYSSNPVIVELQEGVLPPGLEITPEGLIQGYPTPPIVNITLPSIETTAIETSATTNSITTLTVSGVTVGRPVTFSGTVFGGIVEGTIYYVRSVNTSNNTFTISVTQYGDAFPILTSSGGMTVNFPATSVGQPTVRSYPFVLRLRSPLGGDVASYSITVINQNTPVNQGGPGKPINARTPTILNTRPLTINVNDSDPYYGYYILPPVSPSSYAQIGTIQSENYFAFKIIGYDFDGNDLTYQFSNLPSWLTGNSTTGWVTGNPELSSPGINNYNFSVRVYKPLATTQNFNFSFNLSKDIIGNITWITPEDLGTIFNGTISTLSVLAESDVELEYRLVDGTLPPNLEVISNGEIIGQVADQPTSDLLDVGTETSYTFTVQAFSPTYSIVNSTKTFTLNVLQEYSQPTDILYIKAAPNVRDRLILDTLLDNETLIPTDSLYRPNDAYFGKASSVIYEHAYGIYASDIQEYLAAVTRNHYWRNITLGEIKTAVAKNDAGEIIYEVVYSEVIDNLVNPAGQSVSSEIYWPRPIDLNLGPWYTSSTDILTSWVDVLGQQYYTSLTPGYARTLYPNSLYNMRQRVSQVLGQEFDSRLLPLWMTSQQANGSTLGYTQAWVIAYTKPGYSETIKNNIVNNWNHTLNEINFEIDRFTVNKSATYNYDNNLTPPAWTRLPSGTPVPNPLDSKDFYVLFPRQTILPDESQY